MKYTFLIKNKYIYIYIYIYICNLRSFAGNSYTLIMLLRFIYLLYINKEK